MPEKDEESLLDIDQEETDDSEEPSLDDLADIELNKEAEIDEKIYEESSDSMSLDSLSVYLKSIGDIPLLTKDEEIMYATRLYENPEDSIARKVLIERNLKLVVSIAKHYNNGKLNMLDLIQNGNLGLMKATEHFDITKGFRFSTYATWWIKQSITRSIAEQSRVIRLPVHLNETFNKINIAIRNYIATYSHEPSDEELAIYMDIPINKIKNFKKYGQDLLSLDTTLSQNNEDSDTNFYNILEDTNTKSPEESSLENARQNAIDNALSNLTDKEADIIKRYFGLYPYEHQSTLDDIGKVYGITRERVRQIKKKALLKLKNGDRKYRLSDFISI